MNTKAEIFWYTWLKVVATFSIIFGMLLAIFNHTDLFRIVNDQLELIYFTNTVLTAEIASMQYWLIGIIGAVMAGWSVLVYFLILFPLKKKQLWAWNAITVSLVIWFTLDTWASLKYGASFNVIMNVIFIFQYAAPLLFLRSSMQKTT